MPEAQAASAAGITVTEPNTALASSSDLTATYVLAASNQVALVYNHGELAVTMQPATYSNPSSFYSQFLTENNATATVSSIDGLPALVISPDTDYDQSNPAWIEFDLNGIDTSVESATDSTAQLSSVVQSIIVNGCQSCSTGSVKRGDQARLIALPGRVVRCVGPASCHLVTGDVFIVQNKTIVDRITAKAGTFKATLPAGSYRAFAIAPTAKPVRLGRRPLQAIRLRSGVAYNLRLVIQR